MSQFKHFYHNFWWGMCLVLVTIASVNAAVPTFTQLAGNWQIDQNNQFQISSTGEISNLTLTIDTDNTDPIQVSLVGATINSGADTPDTTDDNTLDVQGYPVGGILMGNSTDQTPQNCGMNATTTPNGRCHIRIRATFDSAQTVTFRHQPDTDLFGNYSWFSTTGNREEGDEITGNITTATHGINGGPVLSFQGLTNNTLAFGNQTVNTTSAAKTVTVRNTGTANVTGITVAFTVNYARPSGTSGGTCGTTLNVGASCTIGITFTPTAAGASNGTVTVNSNAPAVTATLTGTGIPVTVLSASPTSLSFSDQIVNTTSAAQLVTIRNNSTTAPVTGIDLTINGGVHYSRPSGTAGGTCPPTTANNFTLAANGSCTIGIAFKPTVVGNNLTDKLVITSAANNINIDVPFTGNGIPIPSVVLSLTPTSLNFGNQTVNTTSAVKTVTLTKTGAAATNLTVNATGSYAISGGTCSNTLNAASCTIGITFRPTATGTNNGTLTVTGTGANTVTATLTGIGIPVITPPTPPAGVTSVPVFGLPGLWILTMLLTSLVGMVGFRKQS